MAQRCFWLVECECGFCGGAGCLDCNDGVRTVEACADELTDQQIARFIASEKGERRAELEAEIALRAEEAVEEAPTERLAA